MTTWNSWEELVAFKGLPSPPEAHDAIAAIYEQMNGKSDEEIVEAIYAYLKRKMH